MRSVAIGDLVEAVSTWNPSSRAADTFDYVDLSAVSQSEKRITNAASLRGDKAPSRARQLIRRGDILVSTVRPNLNGVAPVTLNFDGATASTGFCVFRPIVTKIHSPYLMHWVQSPEFITGMVRQSTGASYPAVSDRIVKAFEIPLPSLDEQQRIAAILDKADALRRIRTRTLQQIDALIESFLLEATNFSSLLKRKIGTIADVRGEKRLPRGHDYVSYASDHKYLRVTDIQIGDVQRSSLKDISESTHAAISRYVVNDGDVVISIAGTIGCTLSIDKQLSGVNLTENAAKITVHSDQELHPAYLELTLRLPDVQRQIRALTGQVTIGKLALFRIEDIEIPILDLAAQKCLCDKIRTAVTARSIAQKHGRHLNNIFASLQHRAFTGQL